MTRRVLDVAIRSEFKKGFGDIAKQFSTLEKTLKGVEQSVNKLANNIDRQLTFKQAQMGAKKFADNQRVANKTVEDGIRIAKRYESAHTALGNKLAAVANAQKTGSVSSKQRLEAEIGLLSQYIKKTGDLSVLQNKNKYRDSKGRFVSFTKDSIKAVSDMHVQVEKQIASTGPRLITKINDQNGRIREAMSNIMGPKAVTNKAKKDAQAFYEGLWGSPEVVAPKLITRIQGQSAKIKEAVANIAKQGQNYRGEFSNRNEQASFYQSAWGRNPRRGAIGDDGIFSSRLTRDVIGQQTGMNKSPELKALSDHYRALERQAGMSSARIRNMNFGPNPAKHEPAFKRLMDSYNRIGFALFQLQATTASVLGLTGIGMIVKQADAFITMQNQVARTSDSLDDLGANMKDVYKISKETFSDPTVVGNMFSRINKYSDALKLSREQVGGVVGGISGAFAASPGNAGEKSASQYQFMQAIQSNRLGGDELRSVLEMAPYVGDILTKGISKLRGMPEGKLIDLRAQGEAGTPVTAKEIVAVFNDPAIQAEIKNMLGRQARTFGDLLNVGKVRLMEMTEQFMKSSGAFSGVINMLARFLADDVKFAKFTSALETATLALVTYGGMLTAQAGFNGAKNVVGALGARAGFGRNALGIAETVLDANGNATAKRGVGQFGSTVWGNTMSNAGVNSMMAAANRENKLISAGRMTTAGEMISKPSKLTAVSKVAENAFLGLGAALNVAKNPIPALKSGFTGIAGAATKGASAVRAGAGAWAASAGMVASQGRVGAVLFRGMGSALGVVGRVLAPVVGLFGGLTVPLVLIASIIALLAMRFNQLLGQMTGGMNIIDILKGTWMMLMDQLGKAASFLKNSFLGEIWNGIVGFVDGILKFIGKAAANNPYFQAAQADRQAGSAVFNGKAGVFDSQGNIVQARVNAARPGQRATVSALAGGEIIRRAADVTAADRAAAFRNGQWLQNPGVDPATPTGNKAGLPETPNKPKGAGNKGPKDPWPEFIRDLNLKVQSVTDLRSIAPGMRDIQSSLNENLRRAMDVTNFDSSGFATLSEAWLAFSATNSDKAAKVNELNSKLKNEKLIEAMREFTTSLTDTLIDMNSTWAKAGKSGLSGELFDFQRSTQQKFLDSEFFKGSASDRETLRQLMADSGAVLPEGFNDNFESWFDPEKVAQYNEQIKQGNELIIGSKVRASRRENQLAKQALDTYTTTLGVFGKQRETQEEINSLVQDFVSANGDMDPITGRIVVKNQELTEQLMQQVALVRARAQIEKDYAANASNGFREAIASYREGLQDVAGQTKDIFNNAFQGLEDSLVDAMSTGKMEWGNLLETMTKDVSRMFIKRFVMTPITNMVEGIGGKLFGTSNTDQTITANNVYINSTPIGELFGAAGNNIQSFMSNFTDKEGGRWFDFGGGNDQGPTGQTPAFTGNFFSRMMGNAGNFMGNMMGGAKNGMGNIMSMIGNFLPPPFNMLSKVFSLFHEGGTVGAATMSRVVNPSVFSNARRYHTGGVAGMPALGVNEVPAILKQGEKVLTASQYSAMNSGGASTTFSPSISVSYTAAPGNSGGAQGGEADAKAISKMVEGAVQQALVDYDNKQRRPGSQGYLANRR